ncbi:hypothetical protein A2V61_03800 [Candidatus Woesebacteria bacterium RBG_19FT_COMBO_47_8]|uniref:BioF2-like acetyltransferase domain-containing protein n=1 Tax=Candidatus Woesebacteria bacterium RBG_13_46_13 TaxID=1802479 RepID=A0A1F7X794_9BACT|nr:MAG: hypothetical protein A2Y68_02100 [Candidatus Woesebacteria bacterium RBG_13_46_13]OGM16795.1 MAG: hypothetical protein A2V61_03800 [Candidatus Woesebacteria bacterium RBG_19FT_COMBO_47_8]HJX59375.1 peptidoglycan bridge formation glycyltransferase FemA/FemB family protein [Patescibacteria group bacterium]
MKDIRQSTQYADYLSKTGWIAERASGINSFIRKFPIVGSVIKIQRPEKIEMDKINKLAKKYRALQIIVEPKNTTDIGLLIKNGYKLSKSPYLPTKTLQIDLTKPKEKIFQNLLKDARHALRKTSRSGVETSSDIEDFRNLWKKSVGRRRCIPPLKPLLALKKSFDDKCTFYLCTDPSKQIRAGAIFLVADGMGYYWQAFTNKEGRRALAQYNIVWEGILWAKRLGAKIFDFEGIYDERFPNKSWLGFTHFKKSFGGIVVEYPGAFIKTRLPL